MISTQEERVEEVGRRGALIEQRVSALRDEVARPLASFGTQG